MVKRKVKVKRRLGLKKMAKTRGGATGGACLETRSRGMCTRGCFP